MKKRSRLKNRIVRSYLTSTVSITLVLLLVGFLSIVILNANRLSDYVRENIGFTLLLDDEVREVEVLRLQKMLNATQFVKSTRYVDKEQAAKELTADLGEDFVGFLGFNPLVASIDVKLYANYMHPDSLVSLEKKFLEYPQITEVSYQRDLVRVISENVQKISFSLLLIGALMLLIFSALINNTIRISVYSQRFTIHTMKLVGATRAFIRKPFLQRSIFFGLLGAIIANLLLFLFLISYRDEFKGLVDFNDPSMLLSVFGIVLLSGIVLSWLSTHLAVNKFLRLRFDELFY